MSSILIFIPYFGTLPEVFPFWYNSALNNPDVDFLFITDCDIKEAPNIKVRKSTLEKEKERFEKALGMEIFPMHTSFVISEQLMASSMPMSGRDTISGGSETSIWCTEGSVIISQKTFLPDTT